MNNDYTKLKTMSEQVVHAYSTYLHLGDNRRFKEIAPYFMRQYVQSLYKDEDRSSEAYIRCYERIEHFLQKYEHSFKTETNHLLPYLKRCAINQYLNVRKAELKLVRELPTVVFDDEYSQPNPGYSLVPKESRKLLLESLKKDDPKFAVAFSLKFDLPMPAESLEFLYQELARRGISQRDFWESHRLKRMKWKSTKQQHLSRINHLNQKIMDQPFSTNKIKWKHYKQNRLRSLDYHMVVGLYSYSELGDLLKMTPESLARCLRYRTIKWKRTWENSKEAVFGKKSHKIFSK